MLLERERSRSKLDQPAVEAAIMGLLLSDEHRGPWTRPEIELEMGGGLLTVCDALLTLNRSGLVHLEGALVIAAAWRNGSMSCRCRRVRPASSGRPPSRLPGERELEILRLRTVDRLTLQEIGERFGIGRERLRQLLKFYFRESGTPPAVRERRARKRARRDDNVDHQR